MLLLVEFRIYRYQSYNLEQNKQSERNDKYYSNESWKYRFDPLCIALYQHFHALLFKK